MNERIKKIRIALGLSQEEFGKRLSIGKASVSKIELGKNLPSAQTISMICSEFNVNAEYLKDGADVPMFQEEGEEDAVLKVLMGTDPRKRDTLRTLCEMPQECWDAVFTLCDYIQSKKNTPGQE